LINKGAYTPERRTVDETDKQTKTVKGCIDRWNLHAIYKGCVMGGIYKISACKKMIVDIYCYKGGS